MIPAARCPREMHTRCYPDHDHPTEIVGDVQLVLIYLKMAGASSSVGGSLPRTRPAGKPG
eukprot:COSAG04_NODE_4300_length_2172_cov_2.879884_2_plen_60_part_00